MDRQWTVYVPWHAQTVIRTPNFSEYAATTSSLPFNNLITVARLTPRMRGSLCAWYGQRCAMRRNRASIQTILGFLSEFLWTACRRVMPTGRRRRIREPAADPAHCAALPVPSTQGSPAYRGVRRATVIKLLKGREEVVAAYSLKLGVRITVCAVPRNVYCH